MLALAAAVVALDPWIDAVRPLPRLLLNIAPVLVIYLAALVLVRRASLAALAALLPLAFIQYINAVKLEELGQPFSIHDIGLTAQLLADIGLFVRYSHGAILLVVVGLVIGLALAMRRLEPPQRAGAWQVALLAIALAGAGWLLSSSAERVYEEAGFYERAWAVDGRIENVGLVAQLVAHSARRVAARPARNPRALARALEKIEGADAGDQRTGVGTVVGTGDTPPDVLVVLSESFFDPSMLAGLEDCTALPGWCRIRDAGLSGEMLVPTFGGNTTRTEFEILTGVPYRALAREVYPYNSVVTRPTQSIAWTFREAGYRTAVVHPHSRGFWNRDLAMPALGFERFIAADELHDRQRRGFWISDTVLTDAVIDLGDALAAPWFLFAISMENHGPWNEERPGPGAAELDRIPVPPNLRAHEALALRQYTYHARAAVAELERLVDWMMQRDRPTLLLFFGDHLPALDEVFDRSGFDRPEPMNRQPVPWLLLSNRDLAPIRPGAAPERSYELGLWLVDRSGVSRCPIQHALIRAQGDPALAGVIESDEMLALYAEVLHRPPGDCRARPARAAASHTP
ncbi:LTA synthase family protein [Halomonas denitrificans]|nr:LTA synthase family protein [Halomonas denitrificans]